ncbi:protein SRC2-like [Bidens hawaiensis]|uniref:protein SRC2-like n=1 Tax=Bidens hawaiensis TaxID=980011 RepID=UPI00404989D9
MDYRALNLTILSANRPAKYSSSDLYVTATISNTASPQIFTSNKSKEGSDLTWNFPMSFMVNTNEADRMNLVVQIKAARIIFAKILGEVRVPIEDLIKDVTSEGKTLQTVSYPVKWLSGEPQGHLSFSYEVKEKYKEKSNAPQGYEYLGNMKY